MYGYISTQMIVVRIEFIKVSKKKKKELNSSKKIIINM